MPRGSVLDKENLPKLEAARIQLAKLKQTKLDLRHDRHKDGGEWNLDSTVAHLWHELDELEDALAHGQRSVILTELADISNMADIVAMIVMEQKR